VAQRLSLQGAMDVVRYVANDHTAHVGAPFDITV
jgi:hypothetical protein